jgi:hypothetical protein
MAMTPQGMCDAVMEKFGQINDSTDWENGARPESMAYIDAFDGAVCTYVEANMEITYSWKAALTTPAATPDPTESFVSKLKASDKTIGQPPTVSAWGPLVMACFAKTEIEHPSGFTLPKGKLLTTKPLNIAPPPGQYPAPLLAICTQIYTWLLACINPAALSGSHASYKGATTGMVIA